MLTYSIFDWVSLGISFRYKLNLFQHSRALTGTETTRENVIGFKLGRQQSLGLPLELLDADLVSLRNSTRSTSFYSSPSYADHSTGGTSVKCNEKQLYIKKDFGDGICDLEPNNQLYCKDIKPVVIQGKEVKPQDRIKIMNFFKSYTISDPERKELWKARIGNRLNITRDFYLGLICRLKADKFPKKMDQQITKDLERSIPHHLESDKSEEMFKVLKRVLRLFCAYRPDVGYIQGMNYLVITLYYYFDEFQLFSLFSNLIICNMFVWAFYNFDRATVNRYFNL